MAFKNLKVFQKDLLSRALEIYRTKDIDFIDAFNFASLEKQGIKLVYSYDKDWDLLEGIKRKKP